MHLDVRLPIGMLFVISGGVLVLFGAVSSPVLFERSLGININVVWSLYLLAFGLMILMLGGGAQEKR